jgi:hypothetical protein
VTRNPRYNGTTPLLPQYQSSRRVSHTYRINRIASLFVTADWRKVKQSKPLPSNFLHSAVKSLKNFPLFSDGKSRHDHDHYHHACHTYIANIAHCYSHSDQKEISMDSAILYDIFLHGVLLIIMLYLWTQ